MLRKILNLFAFMLFMAPLTGEAQTRWLATEHDFGAFDEDDGKVSTRFSFVNEGPAPVSIESVRSSCGCTVPEYSRTPVNQGDTAHVTVVYNPTGRPGRFSKSLVVRLSNDSTTRLLINGVVIGAQNTLRSRFPIEYGPLRLRNDLVPFGPVLAGHIKSQYIEVYNASRQPVTASWSNLPDYLRITAARDTIPPGEQGVYSMILTAGHHTPYGLVCDTINLNLPGMPPLPVSLTAIVEEDFSNLTEEQLRDAPVAEFSLDRLDFGDFTPGSGPITRQLRITNSGREPLLIRRIYTTDPTITLTLPRQLKLKKGKSATVAVTFNPESYRSPILNTRVQIITNDPRKASSTIRLVGINKSTD